MLLILLIKLSMVSVVPPPPPHNVICQWTAHAKGEARRRRIPHSGSVQVCALTFSGYLSPLRVALLLTISNMPWTTHACW
jgi:hypothetical protein